MKANGNTHPGRSVEFLSRLHDGELEAGERARFEAHRAHCAECRRAAIEFDDAIRLFRSSRSAPPRSDLAARILRKVQTTNRPRSPFSPRFRMELGWAALVATAVFALLITSPLFVPQRAPEPVPPPAQEPGVPGADESRPTAPAPRAARQRAGEPPAAVRPGPAPQSGEEAVAAGEPPSRDAETASATPPAVGSAELRRERSAALSREPASTGGEGDASPRAADVAAPMRLSILEFDGFGPAPRVRSDPSLELPLAERGREYVLHVNSQGTVWKVEARPEKAESEFADEPRAAISRKEASSASPLLQMRFEPGNRPRRLLVRIE